MTNTSNAARALNAQRKTHGGPAKKLAVCSHCGEMLGLRERRAHGDETTRAAAREAVRLSREAKKTTK